MLAFYGLAAILGGSIGASEIISRYRDAPDRALQTGSAWLYIVLNSMASLAAYTLVRNVPAFNTIGGTDDSISKQLIQALAAGLSAMALFRSSLFTVRVGNTDIGIGPAAFLQILLAASDRATDRARARPRALAVQDIMAGVSFARAKEALPSLCFALMQGLTSEEQVTFGVSVKALAASDMEDVFKVNSLGLSLMNLVGEDVLRQAVGMLRSDITATPKPIVQSIRTLKLLQNVGFATSRRTLIDGCLFVSNKMQDAALVAELEKTSAGIDALSFPDRRKALLLSAKLISCFGEDNVQYVLASLSENDAVAAPVSQAPSGDGKVVPINPAAPEQAVAETPSRP